jgi:hypothetical protein
MRSFKLTVVVGKVMEQIVSAGLLELPPQGIVVASVSPIVLITLPALSASFNLANTVTSSLLPGLA